MTVMGHEFVGHIVEIGDQVKNLKVGDRVGSGFTTCCGECWYCTRGLTCRCDQGQLYGWYVLRLNYKRTHDRLYNWTLLGNRKALALMGLRQSTFEFH
jgi:threonine dehydrogenase-like Zn-dependent dehydrogenase